MCGRPSGGEKITLNLMILTIPEGNILGGEVPGGQAVATWASYRQRAEHTHLWPVLLGDDESLDTLTDTQDTWADRSAGEILVQAAQLEPEAWLAERADREGRFRVPPRGEWPTHAPATSQFAVLSDLLQGRPRTTVKLALVPAEHGWQVPAMLRYGDWNECPPPEVHCALLKKWEAEYGAELVVMTGDSIEMAASRPPRDREAALRLAHEQFVYCADIVLQGVGTLDALAATVLDARVWYFWWD